MWYGVELTSSEAIFIHEIFTKEILSGDDNHVRYGTKIMLRWQSPPDSAFTSIVTACLELSIDEVETQMEYETKDDEILGSFYPQVSSTFTASEVVDELKKLLEAHKSDSLYIPTDYHFLLLHSALDYWIEFHNDNVDFQNQVTKFFGGLEIGQIDFSLLCDIYFWDEDFLLTPDQLNLSAEAKKMMGFSDETFSVVNHMPPHPDELVLKQVDEKRGTGNESLYRPGEPYPYFD